MKEIKAVIIDKNILVRRALTKILEKEHNAEVYSVKNLTKGEKVIQEENPDIVFLDVEHVSNEAISCLKTLQVQFPDITFVVLSSRSLEGAEAALEALREGASDFVTKPEKNITRLLCGDHLDKRVPPIVKEVTKSKYRQKKELHILEEKAFLSDSNTPSSPIKLIVIGGSIGGVDALRTIFKQFPSDLSIPIVVVQHMPKEYSRVLADELNAISAVEVEEAVNSAALTSGKAWIAKGGYHCEIQKVGSRSFLKLHRGPRENGVRPSIDVLFKSAARLYGAEVLGVLVSGYGTDGVFGAQAIKKAGGHIIIQEPGSAFADTLPKSIIESGLADESYPLEKLADKIVESISKRKRRVLVTLSSSTNTE